MENRFGLLLAGIVMLLTSPATAATSLDVNVGWNGLFRPGHWAPIFLTVSDPSPRNATVEVYTSHDPLHGMRIHQTIPLNSTPTTHAVYIPMQSWGQEMSVVLRDDRTRRRIADWKLDAPASDQPYLPVDQLVAVTGRSGAERLLELQFAQNEFKVPWINPIYLPAVGTGYDAFNLLLLNGPDLARISPEQQEAMIDWVRAGGQIVCWMSAEPPPGSSEVLDALPALVGENIVIEVPPQALSAAGLADRFRLLKGRALIPSTDAREIPLFGGATSAWQRNLGIGSITLLPIDISTFIFSSSQSAAEFWKPLVGKSIRLEPRPQPTTGTYIAPDYPDFVDQRLTQASAKAMEILHDVPGVGEFGFGYVFLVMLGLMLLVGPIDWLVLKRLGRQPWTWVTTTGWIALITLGAVYIGHFLKSGELHYRTLRLIDQADNLTVASTDIVGIYSPRSSQYILNVDPNGWWEPLSLAANQYRSTGRMLTDLRFHQDYRGNRPDPLFINVWNLRFLTSQTMQTSPPVIRTSLSRVKRGSGEAIVGSIENVGDVPLLYFLLRASDGFAMIGAQTLAPRTEMAVDITLLPNRRINLNDQARYYQYQRSPPIGPEVEFDLAIDRSLAIDRLLDSGAPFACLYAEVADPQPEVTLLPTPAVQKHKQYVRAVVPLDDGGK